MVGPPGLEPGTKRL